MTSLAGHGRRVAAAVLDFLFSSALIGGLVAAGFAVGLVAGDGSTDDGWEELGWILLGMAVGLLIGALLWLSLTVWLVRRPGRRNGQTLGKQAVCVWYGPAFFDEQRRGLHDHLCSTRVVLAGRRVAEPAPVAGEELWPATP